MQVETKAGKPVQQAKDEPEDQRCNEPGDRWCDLAIKLELLDGIITLTASDVREDKELFPKVKAKLNELSELLKGEDGSGKPDKEKVERAIVIVDEIISMITKKYPVTVVVLDKEKDQK